MNEVTRERAQSFLTDDHIARIVKAYEAFNDAPGFTRVVGLEEIRARDGNLNIPLYVSASDSNGQVQISTNGSLSGVLSAWLASASDVRAALATILGTDVLGIRLTRDSWDTTGVTQKRPECPSLEATTLEP